MAKRNQPRLSARPDEADQFMRQLLDLVDERITDRVPTMATVKGRDDSNNVRVHLDGEDTERQVGFARAKGQKYQSGDRVMVAKNRAGDWAVLGGMASGAGANAEQAVDNEHLFADSVDGRTIRRNAINNSHLSGDIAVQKSQLAGSLANEISGKADKDYVDNQTRGMLTNRDLQPYAKSSELSDLAKQRSVDDLKAEITALKRRVDKLEKSKSKKEK